MQGETTAAATADLYDLIIVGGGMVGAALACALAGTSLRIALLEAREETTRPELPGAREFDPRVSALTLATRNLLHNIGAWPFIVQQRHSPFQCMRVWDAEGSGRIAFNAAELGQLALGYIVENSVTLNGLYRRLAQLGNTEIVTPATITAISEAQQGCRQVSLADGRELAAALLVGADGAQSQVRQFAGIGLQEKDYRQQAIVTTVKVEKPHQATAWQRFLPTGPLAFLPLRTDDNDDHYCSIVWSVDGDQSQALLALGDADFAAVLGRAFENRLGRIESVAQRFVFPLRQRHADTYIAESLALIGDAAHTIHPLAGQGVNLGFMDVAVLAEEILRAQRRGMALSEPSLLTRYQRRRVADNRLMIELMGGFKQLFGHQHPALRWLRNTGMSMVDRLAPVKNHLAAQAMGLSGELPELARYRVVR